MWPFNSHKRRLEKAITEASEETRHMLMSLVWDRDRLIAMMIADPYVCGYVIGRTLGVASGHAHRNELISPDDGKVWEAALQCFFEESLGQVMAVAKASRTNESSKDQFQAGSRDVGLLALYMSGQADIRNHPEFESIYDALRKVDSNVQSDNPYFPLAFEGIRFARYVRQHFPASEPPVSHGVSADDG